MGFYWKIKKKMNFYGSKSKWPSPGDMGLFSVRCWIFNFQKSEKPEISLGAFKNLKTHFETKIVNAIGDWYNFSKKTNIIKEILNIVYLILKRFVIIRLYIYIYRARAAPRARARTRESISRKFVLHFLKKLMLIT